MKAEKELELLKLHILNTRDTKCLKAIQYHASPENHKTIKGSETLVLNHFNGTIKGGKRPMELQDSFI